jgi:hypothetical protein
MIPILILAQISIISKVHLSFNYTTSKPVIDEKINVLAWVHHIFALLLQCPG